MTPPRAFTLGQLAFLKEHWLRWGDKKWAMSTKALCGRLRCTERVLYREVERLGLPMRNEVKRQERERPYKVAA